jgi:hypothetical protein
MTQILINTTPANSGLGDSPKTAFDKINANFSDIYQGTYGNNFPPAPANLTGAEIVIVNAAGQQENATTAQIAALAGANQYLVTGNPNQTQTAFAAAGNFNPFTCWSSCFPQLAGSGQLTGQSNSPVGPGWNRGDSGSSTAQYFNGAGTNIAATVQAGIFESLTSANQQVEHYATMYNATSPSAVALVRACTNGLPVAGFTMVLYFFFSIVLSGGNIFFGFAPGTGSLGATTTTSSLLNMIGLGKDGGDTNLSFMINNGSGTAAKTSLGVTPASLANQMLRLVITCDGLGNCAITLTNMEAGGASYSVSYPTATAKLPVASGNIAGGLVEPHFYMNNGGTASGVAYGINSGFITSGFASV